ncbi:hypothetical protein AB1Y20_017771 [Prymnesium parvum]|uniref:AMP-dependent synthetase/ligase domain-containing protein n=1 Tax=Prymnesium parvum TaxID=97485 RepID=A0AB34JMP8_PRYPA
MLGLTLSALAKARKAVEPPPPEEPLLLQGMVALCALVATLLLVVTARPSKGYLRYIIGMPLILLDLALWVVTLGPITTLYKNITARKVFAKVHSMADINGEGQPKSAVWRSVEAIKKGQLCTSLTPDCKTAYEELTKAYKKFASHKAQGTRPLVGWRKDEGFKFEAKVFGTTTWRTYRELGEMATQFGAGLVHLGAKSQPLDITSVDHSGVLIYDETSADWMVAAQGAFSQDICVATAYATLGVDSVVKAVVQGGVTVLVCNRKAVPQVRKLASQMPTLKAIVYTDAICTPEECKEDLSAPASKGVPKIISFQGVLALGKETPVPPTPPKPDSIAFIMYTSGSTGDPKGVLISQKVLLAIMCAISIQFGQLISPGADELYIAYLPLAHILELVAELFYFSYGLKVGYADPKSLLGGPERAYPTGALEEFQPTLMAGVPKVWETIKAGAQLKVAKAGAVASFLIGLAVEMKASAAYQFRRTPLFNVLLKKFKKTTGGKLKACLSGGGSISAEVQEWVRTALDCPLVQGYGLTETCAGATIQMPDDMSIGIAGTPISSVEIALHSEPEITDTDGNPYMTTDTSHFGQPCKGRGEVWLRGNSITCGYYKMPKETALEFDKDGFFHTGDIGLLTPGGALKIVDRKKNLVKLKGGEYVALERMNTAYNNSPYVNVEAGGVCSYAGFELDRAVCIAQCKESMLVQAAGEVGVSFSEVSQLCADPKVQEKILASFKEEAKKAGLTTLETVVGVYPVVEPWSTVNGCLTATQKLVPRAVYKFNSKELDIIKKKGMK